MPTLTAGEVQDLTDRIAALINLNLAGFNDELGAAANLSLMDQALAINSRRSAARLLGATIDADRQSLPENYKTALPTILGRYNPLIRALDEEAKAADGGNADSMREWLSGLSATVHPLFAEAARRVLGESIFNSADDVTEVFAPNYQARSADRVYTGADGALAEDTTDANDADTADITLFGSDDHTLYIGSRYKFSQIVVALSTLANTSITPTFQYWNGVAWATLTVTDNGTGFTKNDSITFTAPTDWERHYKDAGGTAFADLTPLYYVRISRTANTLVTPPVGTCIRVVPAAVLNADGDHLGVDQPPLAIARITGANTIVVVSVAEVEYSRFKEPAIQLRALTPIDQDLTVTVSYVNEDGEDTTNAQTAWTAPAALGTKSVSLAGSDTGVRSIRTTGWAVTTNATEGVFEVRVVESRTPAL